MTIARQRVAGSARTTILLSAAAAGIACCIFRPTSASAATMAWAFSFTGAADGANPIAGLTLSNGILYGAAIFGGANGQGTLFGIPATGGTLSVLHAFNATGDGAGPGGTPILDTSGTTLLGTTAFASINGSNVGSGNGTVYSYSTTSSTYSVLHTFAGGTTDGANPYAGLLGSKCSNSGGATFNYYGTTTAGGSGNAGTLFKLGTGSGPFSWIYSISGIIGQNAYAPLACDNFSTLYGATVLGGSASRGVAFQISTSGASPAATNQFSVSGNGGQPRGGFFVLDGSHLLGIGTVGGANGKGAVYLLTYAGGTTYNYTAVYNFGATASDGSGPWATLTSIDAGNTLYGTTLAGGASNSGTAFKLVKGTGYTWTYTQIYSFSGASDGASPYAALAIDASGNLYGTTKTGGANGYGTIFKLKP